MSEMIERIWIECRKCKHRWFPDPNRWKNYVKGDDKLIQCPKCMTASFIPSKIVEDIRVAHKEKRTIAITGKGPID